MGRRRNAVLRLRHAGRNGFGQFDALNDDIAFLATMPNRYNRIYRDILQIYAGSAVKIGRNDSVSVDVHAG